MSRGGPAAVAGVTANAASGQASVTASTGLSIVPKPVSATVGSGQFTLTGTSRIVAAPGAGAVPELSVAADLAAYLRPATGYPLPVVSAAPRPGDIGGDEVPASLLSATRYASFINEEAPIVTARTSPQPGVRGQRAGGRGARAGR